MSAMVVLAPLGYLSLPRAVVATVFGLVLTAAVQLVLAPMIGGRTAFLLSVLLCGATAVSWMLGRPLPTLVLTDIVLTLAVIGVANLWAQGGLPARHVAVLAGLLAGYDLVATGLTGVMTRFATEVQGLPFAPVFAVTGGRAPVSIGLGDLLMLVMFPLTASRAFGRGAGRVAALCGIAVTGGVALLFWLRVLGTAVPLLTVLGPVIVTQYAYWRRRNVRERTVQEWRAGSVVTDPGPDLLAAIEAALSVGLPETVPDGTWLAVDGGRVVGSGASPGLARRAARENGHLGVPLVRQA
jgi:hypothetical protein